MERITPSELTDPAIRRRMLGYDRKHVDTTMMRAAETIDAYVSENYALRTENDELRSEVQRYRVHELALRDALLLAQRAADDIRAAAQRQADAIMEEARQTGFAERVAVSRALSETRWDLERLRQERENFRADFQALLEKFDRLIAPDPLEVPPARPDPIPSQLAELV